MVGGGYAFGPVGALVGYVAGILLGQLVPGPSACGVRPRPESPEPEVSEAREEPPPVDAEVGEPREPTVPSTRA